MPVKQGVYCTLTVWPCQEMLLGGWNPEIVYAKEFCCWVCFVGARSIIELASLVLFFFFFNITFSFDVVWWLHPVQAVVESSALPAVSLRHGRRLFAASQARRGDCRGVSLYSCVPGSEFSVLQSHILKGMWMSIVVVLLNEDWVGKSGMFIFHLMPH